MLSTATRTLIGAGIAALVVVALRAEPANAKLTTDKRAVAQEARVPDAQGDSLAASVAAWIRLDAPTGVEELAHPALQRVLGPGWTADRMGNLIKRVGAGSPRRVIACAMDVPSFNVSEITSDGYIRLHRAGTPLHPLWDQFHEAQQTRVLTSRGVVPGVVAVANGHFARQHRGDTALVNVDAMWVDVGASSRQEAEALGIALLDPVVAERPAWTFAGYASGPAAGARAGCAAVATAANASPAPGSTGERIFVLSSQRAFGWVGLAGVLARLGRVDDITVLDIGQPTTALSKGVTTVVVPAARLGASRQRALARVMLRDSVRVVAPAVLYPGSLVESIHANEAVSLLSEAMRYSAMATVSGVARLLAPPVDTVRARAPRTDAFEHIERTFASLADLPGVPGHEWRVRDAITAALPAWARSAATVDTAGNLIVALGPDRDTVAFIAHMDEVSFEVSGINGNGIVQLARRGGVVVSAWEGQPAMLHFDRDANGAVREPVRGLFVPRDSARTKSPRELTAWFGLDSAALVARGVRIGDGVTAYKRGARLAGTRFTARGSDDRTGSTALLLALQRVERASLAHKVLFVWSTREEGGLQGATAFGAQHGRSLQRVYSVDTFVSSDTPLELPMFAYAPLGRGAVLRVLDDGSIVPRAERDRIISLARARGIPLQLGTTHGATDGSAIAPFGAPNVGLSWPGRYSHSPAEVLDFRDVDALVRLIAAVASLK